MKVAKVHPPPWAILGRPENEELVEGVHPISQLAGLGYIQYAYSAASLAIRFFDSISEAARRDVREVILDEDQDSIANTPSHAQGLIPFCRHNLRMHIKRHVNLWTTGFSPDTMHVEKVPAKIVTKSIGRWILETLELGRHGMPQGSFQLILDGDPLPAKTAEIFQVIQRDIAIQTALDICYDRGILPQPSWVQRRFRAGYVWEDLPRAIKKLQAGDYASLIQCNFDLGVAHDPEDLVKQRLDWSSQQWEDEWLRYEPGEYETEPPLPPFRSLREYCAYPHSKSQSIMLILPL